MDQESFLGRGLRFPLQTEAGKVAMVDGETSIREAIRIILSTPLGARVMNLDFGCRIQELVFAPVNGATMNLAEHYVKEALTQWEPRIEVPEVTATADTSQRNVLLVNIAYTIRALNTKANLVYPFYLQGG